MSTSTHPFNALIDPDVTQPGYSVELSTDVLDEPDGAPIVFPHLLAEDVVECCEFSAKDGDNHMDAANTWNKPLC